MADLNNIPEMDRTQLESFLYTYELDFGIHFTLDQGMSLLNDMYNNGTSDQLEASKFLSAQVDGNPNLTSYKPMLDVHPGAVAGLTDTDFHHKVLEYSVAYEDLMGAEPTHQQLMDVFMTGATAQEWVHELKQDQTKNQPYAATPWGKAGMTYSEWQQLQQQQALVLGHQPTDPELTQIITAQAQQPLHQLSDYWSKYTGETPANNQVQLWYEQGLTATDLQQQLEKNATYGWVKYGMDYSQFQQFKETAGTQYGSHLTNEAAVNILTQQQHVVHGGSMTAEHRPVPLKPDAAAGSVVR